MAFPHDAQGSETWAMQREREKERRRLRDRQRRHNMSQEQRERHLARRRRNYLLRRLKAENAKLSPPQQLAAGPIFQSRVAAALLPSEPIQPVLRTEGLGDGAYKLQSFPRRLRMHQIRCLARALPSSSCHQSSAGVIAAEQISSASSGSIRRLRLVHVKRLARALNSGA